MSQTPIYDELREARPTERTAPLPAATQPTLRLASPAPEIGTVNHLASRRGLGGRHRRPID